MKLLYIDTETTGLYPKSNEIIQLAAIIEIDGIAIDQINLHIQPTMWQNISHEALSVNKTTIEQLESYEKPDIAFKKFLAFLDKYIDKYNKSDKVYPVGHNINFDMGFLQEFFRRYGGKYGFGTYQNWRLIDTRLIANVLIANGVINPIDMTLGTLCKLYNIEFEAHDALNDIHATRQLYRAMLLQLNLLK